MIAGIIVGIILGFLFGRYMYMITGNRIFGWILGIIIFVLGPIIFLTYL